MKRRALALLAGILLLGLMPASASALPPTTLDQSNGTEANYTLGSGNVLNLAQTFVAGKTGMMYEADLWMAGGLTATLELHDVSGGKPGTSILATATAKEPNGGGGWTQFVFTSPYGVTAGTEYALVFDTVTGGTVYGSSDTYPAGQAWILNSGSWGSITGLGSVPSDRPDWAFRTYVDTVGVDLEWDKTQIVGGQNTTLTLTATVTYTYGAVPTTYGAVPTSYTLFVGVIPTWFVPGSITCPASIPSGNCTLAALQGKGIIFSRSDGYETQTVTVTGTASPAASDDGTTGIATGGGCLVYPAEDRVNPNGRALGPNCADPNAAVDVVAAGTTPAPTRTPPPTSTGAEAAPDGPAGAILFLPMALLAFFGGALALVYRRRQVL
jgi:hypothetical protein